MKRRTTITTTILTLLALAVPVALWALSCVAVEQSQPNAKPPVAAAQRVNPPRAAVASRRRWPAEEILLCQAQAPVEAVPQGVPMFEPALPIGGNGGCFYGVSCPAGGPCGELGWNAVGPIPWQAFGPGEYVGHERTAHVPQYRLRVDDEIEFVYRVTRDTRSTPYRIEVGDELRVESYTDPLLNREMIVVQPDGSITLRLLGQVPASRRTLPQLQQEIQRMYEKYYKDPSITVTPLKIDTKLEDLRVTINGKAGFGPQRLIARVTPEGTVALPAVGSVPAQGLNLQEFKRELDERYAEEIQGMEVTPILNRRAPRFVYVVGEVRIPGRFVLEAPTTAMQAIAMAGGWNIGGNLRQVVVFRRDDNWRLMATMLDLRGALYGKRPCPADEIWLNDSDIVVIPKSPILVLDDWIQLVFTRGIYGVLPFSVSYNFSQLSGQGAPVVVN